MTIRWTRSVPDHRRKDGATVRRSHPVNQGRIYKPNGAREVARRLRRMK